MLGMIAVIFIERAIHKILISVFLSREFKHDETNRAWWTGKWYGRGLGAHAMSQPAREFIVKVIELSLWSSDILLGHFLLFMLAIPLLVPYIDRIHATGLEVGVNNNKHLTNVCDKRVTKQWQNKLILPFTKTATASKPTKTLFDSRFLKSHPKPSPFLCLRPYLLSLIFPFLFAFSLWPPHTSPTLGCGKEKRAPKRRGP